MEKRLLGGVSHNIDTAVSKANLLLSAQVTDAMTFRCATRNPWGNSAKFTWFAIEFYPWSWHWKYNEFLTHLNFLVCSFNKSLLTELKQQARLTVARLCTGSRTTWVLVKHPIKAVSAVANLHQVRRLTWSVPVLKGSRNSHGRITCRLFSQAFSPRSFVLTEKHRTYDDDDALPLRAQNLSFRWACRERPRGSAVETRSVL